MLALVDQPTTRREKSSCLPRPRDLISFSTPDTRRHRKSSAQDWSHLNSWNYHSRDSCGEDSDGALWLDFRNLPSSTSDDFELGFRR
jgi:hypothetical protein